MKINIYQKVINEMKQSLTDKFNHLKMERNKMIG